MKRLYIAAARDAEQIGDTRAALLSIQHASALDPLDVTLLNWLGHCYLDMEQFSEAITSFERACALEGGNAASHSGIAQALEGIGRLDDALDHMRQAIQVGPTAARHVMLGGMQQALGDDAAAAQSFRSALSLDPEDPEAMFNLAMLIRHECPTDAQALLEHATKLEPSYHDARRELGFMRAGSGRLTDAERDLRIAAELAPDDPWVHLYLGNTLWRLQRDAEARSHFTRASELRPLWSVPYWLLAQLLDAKGLHDDARIQFKRAVLSDPSDVQAAFGMARHCADFGSKHEAIVWTDHVLKLDSAHARASALRSRLLAELGDL